MPEKDNEIKGAEIYLPEDVWVETLGGEKIKVPKLSWGKEIKLAKIFSTMIKQMPSFVETFSEMPEVDEKKLKKGNVGDYMKGAFGGFVGKLIKILPELLDNAPDCLTQSASVMLDKDSKWIENNLEFDGMVDLVVPFFVRYFKKCVDKMGLIGDLMPENMFSNLVK